VFASDSVPSDTSTDVDDDPWSAIDAMTSLDVPVRSSLTAYQGVSETHRSLFMVPARHKGQRPIIFGRVDSNSITHENFESENESPQFSHYEPSVLRMMENMGYSLINGPGLNFDKGRRTHLRSFVPKRKVLIIIIELTGDWAMCQLQSLRPLSLKSHYITTAQQARHLGSQMLVSAPSSKKSR